VLLGIFAALLAMGLSSANPAFGNPTPSISAKQAEAREVLAQVDELNASLGRSDELLNLANLKLKNVQRDIVQNRHELRIAKHNLAASQREIARRLVTLYTNGTTSTLEVILGAKSLDEVLSRIVTENRVSTLDAQGANAVVL
jgi:peptidoglycan hydrolase CwlO-like protein